MHKVKLKSNRFTFFKLNLLLLLYDISFRLNEAAGEMITRNELMYHGHKQTRVNRAHTVTP